jgi:hypothetical protein
MRTVLLLLSAVFLLGCDQGGKKTLFTLLDNSGIEFNNTLTETKNFNVFNYRNFYNGGGVAIGDLNNDGLADIFFSGNQVANKLYVNLGGMKFKDISAEAGFGEKKQWSTGVTFVDINNDGWLDIYVCNAGNLFDSLKRKNQLFINNQNLTFKESAGQYGLDEMGYTTQASFFDYDMDGDLDCFMVDNSPIPVNTLNYANKRDIPASQWNVAPFLRGGGDHLFRNDNGKFTEVSQQTGIHGSLISLGLGVTVADVNGDGYLDVYVSNDFFERDYLYINQRNGTFKDEIEKWVQHMSLASMGADIRDINNDGYPEIFTTDMLPDNDFRLKTTASFDNYDTYHLKETSGFYRQFMQNSLQLNNGDGKFLEIANFSGVHASDWSWGALLFDADNDGLNDLYICNGIRHDLTDQDFINFFSSSIIQDMVISGKREEMDAIASKMSATPLRKKAFKNTGKLSFKDAANEWGLTHESFSNGAAYGDLDNDGDLDLIVNNVNGAAFVYKNNSVELTKNNYVGFELKGTDQNRFAVGSKINVFAQGQILSRELIPSRGFQSSMDYKTIFGLGAINKIDSVVITWPDRTTTKVVSPAPNKVHHISMESPRPFVTHPADDRDALFNEVETNFHAHQEDDFVDFYTERNIPRMLSKEGPRGAVGDVDRDGLDDVYVGGAYQQAGHLYLQMKNGDFKESKQEVFATNIKHEQTVCVFFDCDKDGDLDLFVGSGGNNMPPLSPELEHQLFENDGRGNFSLIKNAFPQNRSNIGAAVALDFDGDLDLDLFVGGRGVSFVYGLIPDSYFYQNDGTGHFTELRLKDSKDGNKLGMITGAAVANIVGDEKAELIVVGEWMSPRVFGFDHSRVEEIKSPLENLNGWWQSIGVGDLDGDQRADIVLGNIGENFYLRPDSLNPVTLWVNYFGFDGSIQQLITRTVDHKDVPVFMKKNMEDQFVYLKKENLKYSSYATKSIEQLFGDKMTKEATKRLFNFPSSIVAWNEGNGKFSVEKLPIEVQFSSVNAISVVDADHDGRMDILTGGNIFDFTPQFERLDANFGSVMLNNGKRKFKLLSGNESGITVTGQVRDIKTISMRNGKSVLFLRNNEKPVLFQHNNK